MKAVLISIKPKYCELIANKKKTIEIRKTQPKLRTPFKCYIYCTKGKDNLYNVDNRIVLNNYKVTFDTNGNALETTYQLNGTVIGEFICDYINKTEKGLYCLFKQKETALSADELMDYADERPIYGWHISDLKIYDTPKELWELYKPGFEAMEDLDCDELCRYCYRTDYGSKAFGVTPNGYYACEGAWCGETYELYLEDNFALERPPQSWCYVEELI